MVHEALCYCGPFYLLGWPMRYLDAMLALGLAAEIHGTDAAVRRTAERCSKMIERRYRPTLYGIINSRHPYLHVLGIIATIPDSVLTMDPRYVAPPHVHYEQHKKSLNKVD